MDTFAKLQAINAELQAYRAGWVSYDSAHVRQLQAERIALLEKAAAEHSEFAISWGDRKPVLPE